jgi:hypothetical protein
MADDNPYRPRRADPFRRTETGQGDPLAELARLIGQNDPFADLGGQPRKTASEPSGYRNRELSWLRAEHPHEAQREARYEAQRDEPRYDEPRYDDTHYDEQPGSASTPHWDSYRQEEAARSTRPFDQEFRDGSQYDEPHYDDRKDERYDDRSYDDQAHDDRAYDDRSYDANDRGYEQRTYPAALQQPPAYPAAFRDEAYAATPAPQPQPYLNGGRQRYAPEPAQAYGDEPGYESDPSYPDEELYGRPSRNKRGGLLTVMAVLALAIVGTAAAFGYRMVFSNSGTPLVPPVIKAEPGPTKVVPAKQAGEQQAGKRIQDRVGERGQPERLGPAPEQPVNIEAAVRSVPMSPTASSAINPVTGLSANAGTAFGQFPSPAGQAATMPATGPTGAAPNAAVTAPASTAPKKIKTVAIRPDDTGAASPAKEAQNARAAAPIERAPARARTSPTDGNAPISLAPAAAPSRSPEPARSAALAPSGGDLSGSYVQVTSQRSESDARASWRSLQTRYPSVLGSRQATIRRADLGAKGVYYRALVGPFSNASEAGDFCGSLKSAGGDCVVQR